MSKHINFDELKAANWKEVNTNLQKILHQMGVFNPPMVNIHIINLIEFIDEYEDFILNSFGNHLLVNNIQLKSSNHVAEEVTNFLNENK